MATTGTAYIEIRAKLDQLKRDLNEAEKLSGQSADKTAKTTGQKLTATGKKLTQTLTPAAAAIGYLAKQAFEEWDGGLDAIRAGTGATGKELEKLGDSLKRVGGSVTQSLSETGATLAEVNKRTGLTGAGLEELTKNILDLNGRLGNQASVETVTRVFGDWSIKTKDQTEALDALFRTSQATGPSIDALGQLIVKYGAPLRQLGFGFEESAALMGKFEKEGVNTQLVLGSLRIALGKMAQQGVEDPAEALETLVKQIESAGSAGEANALALETFGARAGPDMAAAIREGRFDLGNLFETVKNGNETVEKAAEDTLDWTDKLVMAKNRFQAFIGPVGEVVSGIASMVAVIGPAIWGLGKLRVAIEEGTLAVNASKLAFAGWAAVVLAGVLAMQQFNDESTTFGSHINWDFIAGKPIDALAPKVTDLGKTFNDVFHNVGVDVRGLGSHVDTTSHKVDDFVKTSKKDMDSWKQDVALSIGTAGKDFTKLGEKASLSAEDIETALESMVSAQKDFRKNWKEVSKAAGNDTDDLVNFIAERLGIDAPRATKILADSTNREVKAILRDYRSWKSEATRTESVVSGALSNINRGLSGTKREGDSAEDAIKRLYGSLKNLENISDVKVNIGAPSGDGVGVLGSGGGVAASWAQQAINAVAGPQVVTSGYRPGSITSSGNLSLHSDASNPAQDIGGTNLVATALYLAAHFGSNIRELIHTPLGWGIKNGQKVGLDYWGSTVNADHYDHVHVADFGARIKGPAMVKIGNITEDVHFVPRSGPGAVPMGGTVRGLFTITNWQTGEGRMQLVYDKNQHQAARSGRWQASVAT